MKLAAARSLGIAAILGAALAGSACSGGGGSGGSSIVLLGVEFPNPSGQGSDDPSAPPQDASLVQQIVFRFSAPPEPNGVSAHTLKVLDGSHFPVPGTYRLEGDSVRFTPALPTAPIREIEEGRWDTGGAALEPGTTYFVEVLSGTHDSIPNLGGISGDLLTLFHHPSRPNGILISYVTTEDPDLFLAGLPADPIRLTSVTPADGTGDFAPFLYSDPQRLFPENRSIEICFDAPLLPDYVSDLQFLLIDLDDLSVVPAGLPLGVNVELLENLPDSSRVRMTPNGILPLGHLLAVEIPEHPMPLSSEAIPDNSRTVISAIRVADGPSESVPDLVQRPFDEVGNFDQEESTSQLGATPAEWDVLDSNVLQAASAFPGSGVLGRFVPADLGDPRVITLDTNQQRFPLVDGSTPDAPPDFIVYGGVFDFTDIAIPADITITTVGPNPLILVATGSVTIHGTIDFAGKDGVTTFALDTGNLPVPGGNGRADGGDGGQGQPTIFYPPDQIFLLNQVPPSFGTDGLASTRNAAYLGAQIGGHGGRCGILDEPSVENPEIFCGVGVDDRGKSSHAGGGTFLSRGTAGIDGFGNITPNPDCTYSDAWPVTKLDGGRGGDSVFLDKNPDNDFIGAAGEIKVIQGGQGGGGGGSRTEAYYCGFKMPWGRNQFMFLWPDTTADSRGGGGGAGGGAFELRALGPVVLGGAALLDLSGGDGGGGELTGGSTYGGGGGGGSGGAALIKSAHSIVVRKNVRVDVRGGKGDRSRSTGEGGAGIVQFQVPYGARADVSSEAKIQPPTSWVDSDNLRNPVEFTPLSVATSRWFDMGRAIDRPPRGSNPRFEFSGLNPAGFVITDPEGYIPDPSHQPFDIHYLGRYDPVNRRYYEGEEPVPHWIPPEATVRVQFQAADAITEGSKEIDPASQSTWASSPIVADGRQFVRFRVTFDLTANGGTLGPSTKRPSFRNLLLNFQF